MKRQIILSTALASTLLFSSVSALSLWTSTCNYFGISGCASSENPSQNIGTSPQAFSFENFFNNLPKWNFNANTNNEQIFPTAQSGQTPFSPGVVQINNNNAPNANDFGLGTKSGDNSLLSPVLLSQSALKNRKNTLESVIQQCSKNASTDCVLKVTQQNAQNTDKNKEETLFDPKNPNPVTPNSEYGGTRASDTLTGTQSPNYDSGEENHINSGPLARGVEDSQIRQSAQNYNGSQYFVNRGTGSCSDYGIDVGGSCPDRESYKSDFKATMSNLCSNLTGKRLQITSGNRSAACNARVGGASGSSHMSGLAMDTRLNNYSEGEKVIVVMYLAAQGFNNFGGYGPNAAMHFDMRSDVNRWGPNYSISSCESRLFPDYFRKAMSIMGSEPCQRDYNLREKAVAALNKMGKSNFATPANNKVSR